MRKLQIAGAMAAAALCASSAIAQGVAQHSHPKLDLTGWSGTADTLPSLIRTIQSTTGGRVLEIRYSNQDGGPGFRAAVAEGKRVVFLHVNAEGAAGAELTATSVPDWMLHWRSRADIVAARQASVSLDQAITTAEAQANGAPAVAAGIAASASNPTSDVKAYNVLVSRGGDVHRIAVDDQTGQVIEDPGALADWP
jgi:uncharacterized membrane protein YkoI